MTPTAETIKPQDIQATLQEIGVVYRYTNRVADLYEDDVPAEIIQLTGRRMGLVRELMRLGVLRAPMPSMPEVCYRVHRLSARSRRTCCARWRVR